MKFGLCGDASYIDVVKDLGYDYLELPMAQTAALPESEFVALYERLARANVKAEVCNVFLPRTVRLTGEQADLPGALTYADAALGRAATLGVKVVVFGSAGARNVPDGFPAERAWTQLVAFLRALEPIAGKHGVTIAIEHLNKTESNILNSVSDGLRLAKEAACPHIAVLVDSYHLFLEHEDPAIILKTRRLLRHVHVAHTAGRVYPTEPDGELRSFFSYLRQIGYRGRVSVEGKANDLRSDAAKSLGVLRELAG